MFLYKVTDTIESQFGESVMDEDKVVWESYFWSLNTLIAQLKMYRAPNFPRCFLFRLQMKKQKKKTRINEIQNKNDTKKGRKIE